MTIKTREGREALPPWAPQRLCLAEFTCALCAQCRNMGDYCHTYRDPELIGLGEYFPMTDCAGFEHVGEWRKSVRRFQSHDDV